MRNMYGALIGKQMCTFPSTWYAMPERIREDLRVVSIHLPLGHVWTPRQILALVAAAHDMDKRTLLFRDDPEYNDWSVVRVIWPVTWLVPAYGPRQVPDHPSILGHAAYALLRERRLQRNRRQMYLDSRVQLGQGKWVS